MRRFLIIGAVIVASAFPLITYAAFPFDGQIVPDCTVGGAGPGCQACDLLQLANNLIQFGVTLSVAVATLMFAYAGFLYVTASASPSNLEKAKKVFGNVFLGLLLVLTAWLIIDLTLTVFTGKGFGQRDLECVVRTNDVLVDNNGNLVFGSGAAAQPGELDTDQLTHNEVLEIFNSCGVSVTSSSGPDGVIAGCSGVGCTNLEGVRAQAANQICAIQEACGNSCNVLVTGGTETNAGHARNDPLGHVAGYGIDIHNTNAIDNFLYSNLERAGQNGGDPVYQDSCGNRYTRESDHWDIKITAGVCPIGG